MYRYNDKPDVEFWKTIKSNSYSDADIDKMKLNINLALFSEFNLSVFNAMQSFASTNSSFTLKSIAEKGINWTNALLAVNNFPK